MDDEINIGWKAIVVGNERPGLFQRAMANLSQGWSPEFVEGDASPVEYPIDIVLGLERESRLTRLELTAIGWMAPHQVEIKFAEGREFLPLNYVSAKRTNYFDAGKIKFPQPTHQNGQDDPIIARKFHRIHCQFKPEISHKPVLFVWLILHSPHPFETNPRGKIALSDLKIFGLNNGVKISQISSHQFAIEDEVEDDELENWEEEKKIKRNKNMDDIWNEIGQNDGKKDWRKNEQRRRKQFGESAEDFVKIEEKLNNAKQKAKREGNSFKAILLEKALANIGECQATMFSLRSRRRIAAAQGREDEVGISQMAMKVEFLQGAMSHCMDNYARSNQMDLLLDGD